MRNHQADILSSNFQSRGFAFRIVGPGSGCLEVDDVVRQLIAEAVQSFTLTKVKKLHRDPTHTPDAISTFNRSFGTQFALTTMRHSGWRKLNRAVTRVNRLCDRWLG